MADEEKSAFLHNLLGKIEAGDSDATLLHQLEMLSPDEREELATFLLERESQPRSAPE